MASKIEIPGFPGYWVSSDGRVWSTKKPCGTHWSNDGNPREVKQYLSRHGYLRCNVRTQEGQRTVKTHVLVLITFVGPCPDGRECDHINGIRTDNRLENLRWVTPKDNCANRDRIGMTAKGERSGRAKLSSTDVRDIYDRCKSGESRKSISCDYPVTAAMVGDIALRLSWKHIDLGDALRIRGAQR